MKRLVAGVALAFFASSPGTAQQAPAGPPSCDEQGFGGGGPRRLPAEAGLNRFVWDLRYPDATRFPGLIMWSGSTSGPRAALGTYQVKLTVDGKSLTQSFEIKKDPRLETTQADFARQLDLLLKIRDKFSETTLERSRRRVT